MAAITTEDGEISEANQHSEEAEENLGDKEDIITPEVVHSPQPETPGNMEQTLVGADSETHKIKL